MGDMRTVTVNVGGHSYPVFVGNGSDEVLAHVFRALLKHDAPVLFPDITYSFYPVYCGLYGIDFVQVPLNAAFEIDLAAYRCPNGGIVFPNPNAPTGRLVPVAEIEQLLQANTQSVVVIDEAYVDFGGESCVPLIDRYADLAEQMAVPLGQFEWCNRCMAARLCLNAGRRGHVPPPRLGLRAWLRSTRRPSTGWFAMG